MMEANNWFRRQTDTAQNYVNCMAFAGRKSDEQGDIEMAHDWFEERKAMGLWLRVT